VEEGVELVGDRPCPHCGYRHYKRGGWLKWHIGALNCRLYVEHVLEEQGTWGVRSRPPISVDDSTVYRCTAPESFVCFWKTPDDRVRGGLRCASPDGYPSEVPGVKKLELNEEENEWKRSESLLCPHRTKTRILLVAEKTGRGAKSRGSDTFQDATYNEMPGTGDPKKQRVYSELQRRIRFLTDRGLRPTPSRIAKLGGFVERTPTSRGGSGTG
jgi:hypothetical protein